MKTLIIDDDMTTRTLLVRAMESLGHWAVQSGNGRHGWETLWENRDTGLVVTDMIMPDMDGGELTQLIRGNAVFESLPIIIISGVLDESEVASLLEYPKCKFLSKPVNLDEFKALVRELLPGTK